MADLVITVQRRESTGKNESRRLRKQGKVPAILYGEQKDPVSLSVDVAIMDRLLHSKTGINTVFELMLEGTDQRRAVMVKEYQIDPVTDRLTHCDLLRIDATHEVHVPVHVELMGLAAGVKNDGGLMEFSTREIQVACLPKDIPVAIQVDVSALNIGQVLRVGDLKLPDGVRALTDKNTVICGVHTPKAEAEAAPGATTEVADAAAATAAPAAADAKKGADAGKKAAEPAKKAEAPKADAGKKPAGKK